MNSLSQVLLIHSLMTRDRNALDKRSIPLENSHLVKTIYVMIHCKDQFSDVSIKHWTFQIPRVVLHSPPFYYSMCGRMTSFIA